MRSESGGRDGCVHRPRFRRNGSSGEGQTEGLEDFSPSGPKVQDVLRSLKQLGSTSRVTPGLGRLDEPRREQIEAPTAESAGLLDERPDPPSRRSQAPHGPPKSAALGGRAPSRGGAGWGTLKSRPCL